jgi:hypothetical protein
LLYPVIMNFLSLRFLFLTLERFLILPHTASHRHLSIIFCISPRFPVLPTVSYHISSSSSYFSCLLVINFSCHHHHDMNLYLITASPSHHTNDT